MLNAFRHHGLYRGVGELLERTNAELVLNAFRHHGLYRAPAGGGGAGPRECSTPFGITDYIGRRRGRRSTAIATSAQRLSASRIISGQPEGLEGLHHIMVLNAFRHHGLYRDRPRVVEQRLDVEVLNAFRHHGLYRDRSIRADEGGFV